MSYFLRWLCLFSVYSVVSFSLPSLNAHPVPRKSHDRTVIVRITPTAIVIDYRLEIDEWTVVYVDLPAVDDKVDISKLKKPVEFYDAFTRCYAPILAKNLIVKLDGKEIELRCVRHGHRVADHLQCDFHFEAACALDPAKQHSLSFREGNYELESGMLRLSLGGPPDVSILDKTEPNETLKNRPASELEPGDDEKLRKASATFQLDRQPQRSAPDKEPVSRAKSPPADHQLAGSSKAHR